MASGSQIAPARSSGRKLGIHRPGKLGAYTVGADNTVLLGPPFVFDASNINKFNF